MMPAAKRVDLLVSYDVDTTTAAGRKRLRRIAKLCTNHGQRVQWSVFACRLTAERREAFVAQLLDVIAPETDSLHVYTLPGGRDACVRTYGVDRYRDFDGPLVV